MCCFAVFPRLSSSLPSPKASRDRTQGTTRAADDRAAPRLPPRACCSVVRSVPSRRRCSGASRLQCPHHAAAAASRVARRYSLAYRLPPVVRDGVRVFAGSAAADHRFASGQAGGVIRAAAGRRQVGTSAGSGGRCFLCSGSPTKPGADEQPVATAWRTSACSCGTRPSGSAQIRVISVIIAAESFKSYSSFCDPRGHTLSN